MLLPFLFYHRLLNSPHGAILREGYSFSESVSISVFVPEVFLSSFLIFRAFLFVLLLFLNILPESGVLWLSSGGTPESELKLLKSNNYSSLLTVFYFS